MVVTTFTPAGTAPGVLALSKAAWRAGISISKFDQDDKIVESTIKDLAGELKTLSSECDLIYNKLEGVTHKIETVSPPPYDVDDRVWKCLAMQADEASGTLQELEVFMNYLKGENSSFINEAHRLQKSDKSKTQIAHIRTKVWRHTEHLRATMQLIETALTNSAPVISNGQLSNDIEELQDMVRKLEASSQVNSSSQISETEFTLVQCARNVIERRTSMYKAEHVERADKAGFAHDETYVSEWVKALAAIRHQQSREHTMGSPNDKEMGTSGDGANSNIEDHQGSDSDDDLEVDLARAALATGTEAFGARNWSEADSLLREAIRVLQQLSKSQRAFCDLFDLHYKLAVCAYHTRHPIDSEMALTSLLQMAPNSDEQRRYICDATDLLAQLCIRTRQLDRARSECEKALQSRRRLLGKGSDASLESLALLAHIQFLLGNRPLAKSCLSMIPETRREAMLAVVEESLGSGVEHLDFVSLLTQPDSSSPAFSHRIPIAQRLSGSTIGHVFGSPGPSPRLPHSSTASPATSSWEPPQSQLSVKKTIHDQQSDIDTPVPPACGVTETGSSKKTLMVDTSDAQVEARDVQTTGPQERSESVRMVQIEPLGRKEVLQRIGCQPRDKTEEAVCNGDHTALANSLNKKKSFWRSSLRKRGRPERVTALHFAALFGEIGMARQLLNSNFNINEIPFGYSTNLTPLHFAIGARQVDMVQFLIANGARPSEPDTWSSLVGQLMTRSWLTKTMSDSDRESVPEKIVAIMRLVLKQGWSINAPHDTSGKTVLHQAVGFWTGEYQWDLNLRIIVTTFLCENGANPLQEDKRGRTPKDMAIASGHQELIHILARAERAMESEYATSQLVELPAQPE